MDDEKVQPDNPEGETPGKKPGEGASPVEQDIDTSGGTSLGGDPDSAATGTTPTEGGGDPAGGPGTEGGGP